MDLGFVNNGFGGSQQPKDDGPIGFLGNPVSQQQQRSQGMMGGFQGLGAGVGGYQGYGRQAPQVDPRQRAVPQQP
jgi:hypothetical protein